MPALYCACAESVAYLFFGFYRVINFETDGLRESCFIFSSLARRGNESVAQFEGECRSSARCMR
jgi:hypothetical protein